MFAGFDYGTSNCAIGVLDAKTSAVQLQPIERGQAFMPSALYALERELICEAVSQNIHSPSFKQDYLVLRKQALLQAQRIRHEYSIKPAEQALFTGHDAFDQYIGQPDEGYFIKSPKSFLGASGLRTESVFFFEDIVTAMMQTIKSRAEENLQASINHTVIGRPVNFQGIDAEKSNSQAIEILTTSAKRAGFQSVEFLYEPLAAGMDFETRLTESKIVLVVDVGGGTTDCSIVQMGPEQLKNSDRSADFLGHSGERIGGNDLDIQLAAMGLLPLFGMNSTLKNGLRMPTQHFWNAVKTNDLGAQTIFNNLQTELHLQQLLRDTQEPKLLEHFIKMREHKKNYQLVRIAEKSKIALSDSDSTEVSLEFIADELSATVTTQLFADAIEQPISKILGLMGDAIAQAGCQPDLIYVTGGSAKSPVIRAAIEKKLGNIEVVDGDHFGSVAAGLTVWADRLYR